MNTLNELVYYATKAPSGHNTQPWKFKIQENGIEIHPDFKCSLPVVDPNHRELFISLGCATENICTAAPAFGYNTNWSIEESSHGIYFIRINLNKLNNIGIDVLKIIENRQTNRSIYSGKIVDKTILNQLNALPIEDNIQAYYFKNGITHFSTIKEYIIKGNEIQMTDISFKNELLSWIRFNRSHIKSTKNGLTYKVMGSPPTPKMIGKQMVKFFLTPGKQNKSDIKKIDSSSHIIVLTTKTNSNVEWIKLGMYLERILLKLTELNVASAFLNPPCELESLSGKLQKEIPINNEYPTIILRIGYAKNVPFSPRKDVEQVIM